MFKQRVASGLGCILEWYDFALYGFLAPILAQLYFPNESPTAATLSFFAVFAVGFICRPLGALIFGYISDKYGRATCLKLTPLLMTAPTILLAFLPTYQQIGALAPVILVILRAMQGICIGGEFTNNIVYLCETAPAKKLYLFGSIGACTGTVGILLASTVAACMFAYIPHAVLLAGAWRLAFAVALLLGLITFWLRRKLAETPVYESIAQSGNAKPIVATCLRQWRDYGLATGIGFLPATSFYFVFVFLPNYLQSAFGLHAGKLLADNSISMLLRLFIIPAVGILAGCVGGVKLARLASILFLILSIPIFACFVYSTHLFVYGFYAFALLTTINAGTMPGLLIELLSPETRCSIFSFAYNLCIGVFGGIVPYIGFLLVQQFGSKMAPVLYLEFAALVTLSTTFLLNKRRIRDENSFQLCADFD